MTRYELIKVLSSTLLAAQRGGVTAEDIPKLPIYEEYESLKAQGVKVTAIVAELAVKHDISEMSVYRCVKKMKESVCL